jgi:hypothetical protein
MACRDHVPPGAMHVIARDDHVFEGVGQLTARQDLRFASDEPSNSRAASAASSRLTLVRDC